MILFHRSHIWKKNHSGQRSICDQSEVECYNNSLWEWCRINFAKKQREWEKQVIDNLQKEKKYKSRQCIIITLKMIEEEPPAQSMAYWLLHRTPNDDEFSKPLPHIFLSPHYSSQGRLSSS